MKENYFSPINNHHIRKRIRPFSVILLTIILLSNHSRVVGKTFIPTLASESDYLSFQRDIHGVIRNKSGQPLGGATISIQGSSISTTSDSQGRYSIRASHNARLIVTYVGYESLEIDISNRSEIDIVLTAAANTIEEVVTTGYQNINRRLFTGASTKVLAKDAERVGVPDISRMLEGQVAGVSIQNVSSTFGAAPKIRVRGATSISGDNRPLWVIDGVILEDIVNISNEQLSTGDPNTLIGSSVAGLNPDDIESFEILRDASATSMYGARAMNGVVIVTTKSGRNTEGKPVLSYTGNFTTFLKPTYDQFDIMNSADQMFAYLEIQRKGGLEYPNVMRNSFGGVFRKMYEQFSIYDPVTDTYALQYTPQQQLQYLNRYANANTNWFDILFDNSLMQEHSLSVTSGTPLSQYYASTSFMNDDGWMYGNSVRRFTGNMRGTFQISEKFQLELLSQASVREQWTQGAMSLEDNSVLGSVTRNFELNPFTTALNTNRTMTAFDENGNREFFTQNFAPFNILHEIDNNNMKTSMIDFKMQAAIQYKITKDLKYGFDGAYRFVKTDREQMIRENANAAQAYRAMDNAFVLENNRFLYLDRSIPGSQPQSVLEPNTGFYNLNSRELKNYYMRHSLDYNTIIEGKHRIGGLAFSELRYTDIQPRFFQGVGYQYERGGVVQINPLFFQQQAEANTFYYGNEYSYERFLSYMARGSYSYDTKYNFNATIRYDGSNQMGLSTQARWLPTWNLSGSWNIDSEEFFKRQNLLSSASLRATYGLTASPGPARNSQAILLTQLARRTDAQDRENQIYIDQLENSELTFEKQYETNIGVNLGFLQDRLNLIVDVYQRNGFDLISPVLTPGIGGQAFKLANNADMRSKGLEFTLNALIINKEKFSWRSNLNFGYHTGKITSLENRPFIFNLITERGGARVGYAQRGLFSVVFDGLDPITGVPTFINENGDRNSTEVYFQSSNLEHLRYEGPIDPTLTGGFSNTFRYGGFSVMALITFSGGNYVRLYPSFSGSYNDVFSMSNDFLSRWVLPYDELSTNVPSIADAMVSEGFTSREYPYNTYNYSTERVARGDFARLKQVMVTYQLPNQLAQKFKATNASISAVGNNLLLLYSDSRLNGQDPEFFSIGGVAGPIPRQFSLSLKLGF